MGVVYSINAINNSTQIGSICVFQSDPNVNNPQVLSLAWFTKVVAPRTRTKFTWTIDYSFVWAETGQLIPGIIFDASQTFAADLSTTNQITFTSSGGAFDFINQTAGPAAGSLYIMEDRSIPLNIASVGIGMSGAGTFAVPSQPNMTLIFSPHPKYWITFGNYTRGEVLDITSISQKAQVAFPSNVFSMTATFGADNQWAVTTTAQANAAFVAARKVNPQALWGEASRK
jgi:hypothetical protein